MEAFEELKGTESFEELNPVDAGEAKAEVTATKKSKDELEQQVAQELRDELISNEEFKGRFKSRVNDLVIVKTLGFSDKGGQISKGYDDSTVATKGKSTHMLETVAEIVGYVAKNVGDTDITCPSKVWKKDGDKFVSEDTTLVIKPGEEKAITKRDMMMITVQPEFAGEFGNGVMVTKLKTSEMAKYVTNLDYIADKYYIKFNDGDMKVHDDANKINISHQETKGDQTIWVVNDEYASQFGYLNNEPDPKAPKARKEKAPRKPKLDIKIEARNVKAAFLAKALQSGQAQ